MSSSEVFDDIANAVYRLRVAFKKHHLAPPKALELGSNEDMARLLSAMPVGALMAGTPAMHDKPMLVTSIAGIDIVAPAKFRARKRGGFDVV